MQVQYSNDIESFSNIYNVIAIISLILSTFIVLLDAISVNKSKRNLDHLITTQIKRRSIDAKCLEIGKSIANLEKKERII